ncbi:hypothetical protein T05_1247 [Trichinella murrelli]|uniref:Uncharacterized protein n=1 Tax=Trichinella murrelli TaxID=144512 RepID=A0A0V0UAI7_9BILA|nr:hypothetical protein T05_1247 [Trichinella murrelli]
MLRELFMLELFIHFEFFKNVAQFGLVAIVFSWHIKTVQTLIKILPLFQGCKAARAHQTMVGD